MPLSGSACSEDPVELVVVEDASMKVVLEVLLLAVEGLRVVVKEDVLESLLVVEVEVVVGPQLYHSLEAHLLDRNLWNRSPCSRRLLNYRLCAWSFWIIRTESFMNIWKMLRSNFCADAHWWWICRNFRLLHESCGNHSNLPFLTSSFVFSPFLCCCFAALTIPWSRVALRASSNSLCYSS